MLISCQRIVKSALNARQSSQVHNFFGFSIKLIKIKILLRFVYYLQRRIYKQIQNEVVFGHSHKNTHLEQINNSFNVYVYGIDKKCECACSKPLSKL